MIAFRKIIALLFTTIFLLAAFTFGTVAAENVTVDIVSFSRGAQEDLRSSELLEANVTGYDGNVRELTYEWTSTIGTYLYVYNNHNMYGINNTDGEIEIYNGDKDMSGSANMSGRTYNKTFQGKGYAWAAVYGANVSGEDFVGKITVKVYDAKGNLLATDSHEGIRENIGSWFRPQYVNRGIVASDFANDVSHVRFGLFEGDTKNVKILLGESSIVHITCTECSVSNPKVVSGEGTIAIVVDNATKEAYIKSVEGTSYGDAKVAITIKKGNCKFHQRVSATREIEVFVYKKPTTTSTATAIMLDNLDNNCTYYIGGVKGVKKTVEGKEYVVFENLTPNTQYQIEVVGQAANTEPVYAYVYETTKPAHVGTVKVLLDGTYDTATGVATGTPKNIEEMMPAVETLYLRYEDSEIYFPLDNTATGVYSSELSDGNYTLYYSINGSEEKIQLGNQILTINGASRTRDVFFNSVTYDLNGGEAELPTEYYLVNSKVTVSDVVPVQEGYLFSHWVCQDGHEHKADGVLTEAISTPYTLVAQYVAACDVYVDIEIRHASEDGKSVNNDNGMHDIIFTVDRRFGGEGNYTQLTSKSVEWDGVSSFSDEHFGGIYAANTTTYYAKAPFLVNVIQDAEYTVTANKSGYDLVSVEKTVGENGDFRLHAVLVFDPNNFDFTYTVELDEESMQVADDLKPKAVNVKVLSWYDPIEVLGEEVMWWHITQHENTYERIELDENGKGSGTYPVWMATTDTETPYSYRIEVVSYELSDGTILPAINVDEKHTVYQTEFKRYIATVGVDGGKAPAGSELDGAYYQDSKQNGAVKALVHIEAFDIIFDPNGGMLNGSEENTVLRYQIGIPDLSAYVPTRDGGYVFDGWRIADENGNMTEEEPISGTIVFEDKTLVAKWREPLTIKGHVAVAGTYSTIEDDMPIIHEIHEYDRLNTVTVLLQRVNPNGYTETVQYIVAPVMSTLFEGDHGIAAYEFTGIEDHGDQYRIKVSAADYHSLYNNDTSSIPVESFYDYVDESRDDLYLAEFLNDEDVSVANVYAFLYFDPQNFPLEYQVDSSYIGSGFAPDEAEVLVLYDTGERVDPQSWTPISQMIYAGMLIGNDSAFVNDIAKGSEPVWMSQSGTGAVYDYSIRVKALTFNGEKTEYDNYSLPYYIAYNGSARYSDINKEQTQLLTATIYPRMYTVTFELGEDMAEVAISGMESYLTVNETFEDTYYWSYGKVVNAKPVAEGYTFLGWYDADGNRVTAVAADSAKDITLYAKWTVTPAFETLVDAGYYSATSTSEEKEGIIALNARISNYDAVKDHLEAFGIYIYDTTGKVISITASSADLDQLAVDGGEYHVTVSGIAPENFTAKVLAAPYVVVNGEIVIGETMTGSVAEINKWLGEKKGEDNENV